MGTGAASDAYYDGLEKGLDNETALVRGFLSGAAEIAFEKIGLDNLFKAANEAGEQGIKSALKRAGLQPVIGSLEEGGTEITNILTDILVSGELSDYKTLIKRYTAQGLSEKDAQAMARRDLAEQVGTAMLAGLVSDAAMGAGAAGYAAYHHEGTYDADAAASQGQDIIYSPINPNEAEANLAQTFEGGTYTERVLTEDTVLYRVYGGNADKIGRYFTRTPQKGGLQSQLDLALNPIWGNTAENVVKIIVPKGTKIYEGTAAPQNIYDSAGNIIGSLPGGGNQIYIPKVDERWFE